MSLRAGWTLDGAGFERLLARLDPDRERAGARYESLRAGLLRFFEWRGCAAPAEHADQVLDRVARKIDEGEVIEDLAAYAAGVARLVYKEVVKQGASRRAAMEQMEHQPAPERPGEDVRLDCLRECVGGLPAEESRLLLSYYEDDRALKIERRRKMADELGIALSALRMRMQRLRDRLEACAVDCVRRVEGAAVMEREARPQV
jgi:DNA-directed RNA polymerase specialized sigma24 family protein